MLPKVKRLSKKKFPHTPPRQRVSFPWGEVFFYSGEPAVAVVVSKRVLKKAVDRNRARRRVYGALGATPLKEKVVFRLKKQALTAPQGEFVDALSSSSDTMRK